MLKKTLLRLTVAGAVALGAVNIANASTTTGPYFGGQLGWADTHTGLSSLHGNENINHNINIFNSYTYDSTSISASSDTSGLAGRIFIGYQFSPNFAAEFGFAKFHDNNFKGNYSGSDTVGGDTDTLNYSYRGVVKTHAFDILGKGILPLDNNFSVFGKLGLAYVQQTNKLSDAASVSSTDPNFNFIAPPGGSYSEHNNRFMPVAGVGISYDITPNVPVDVSWLHYQKMGGNIPNIDLLSLGLAYKIND